MLYKKKKKSKNTTKFTQFYENKYLYKKAKRG